MSYATHPTNDTKAVEQPQVSSDLVETTSSIGMRNHEGLRRVPDSIPKVVLLIILVELGERFTYFGLSGPLQNYIKYVRRSQHGRDTKCPQQ